MPASIDGRLGEWENVEIIIQIVFDCCNFNFLYFDFFRFFLIKKALIHPAIEIIKKKKKKIFNWNGP